MKMLFKENQKFNQWWLWIILIGIGILPIYGIYKQIIKDEIFGDKPMSNFGLIIFSFCVYGFIYFFWYMSLNTEIDNNEIKIHFKPFLKKKVNWNEIKSVKIVNYGFVGYGIRFGSKHGTVYNTNGNKGLAIELKNGKKFVIGTQKETEMNTFVEKMTAVKNVYNSLL
jgi:hypothetical protein